MTIQQKYDAEDAAEALYTANFALSLGHKEVTVTHLRELMLDELQLRNYAQDTVRAYIPAVEDFARYFHRSPDRLTPEHIREYQVLLFRDCKLSPGTIEGRTAALRFLFVKTLRRAYLPDHIPFPKRQRPATSQ